MSKPKTTSQPAAPATAATPAEAPITLDPRLRPSLETIVNVLAAALEHVPPAQRRINEAVADPHIRTLFSLFPQEPAPKG